MEVTSYSKRLINMDDGAIKWSDIYTDGEGNDFALIEVDGTEYYVPVLSEDGNNTFRENGSWIEKE